MKILNRKKNNQQSTSYEKCQELVHLSTVPANEVSLIMHQIQSIIDELNAIHQPIDELEIVSEVLEQNDYEFINSQQANLVEKSLKINKSGRELILTDEAISKLNIDVKLGGLTIDLRDYKFNGGNLLLNVHGSFSGIEIYINNDVAVSDWIENKYSGISYVCNNHEYESINQLPKVETKHTLTLEGKIKGSGITFYIDHQGDYVNPVTSKSNTSDTITDEQLNSNTLSNQTNSAQHRAEQKRIRHNSKIERKKARLDRKLK